jgi:hypothetical protein
VGFSADIDAFAKKAGASVDETLRAVALELFGSVIKDTPVDTGRAKGNWQTTIGAPASGEVDRAGDGAALAEVRSVSAQFSGDKTIFLTNNLPYIRRLEYDGWSDQAPNGFVRKNVARIQSIVAKEARANKI